MQISMKAAGTALVSLAFAGTCLACGWGTGLAYADAAATSQADAAAVASATSDGTATPAVGEAFADGVLTFAGLQVQLPEDMDVRVAGTLASAVNDEGTLTASVEDLSRAALPAGGDVASAFKEAANKTVAGYSTASVQDKGTVELAEGVTGYVYELDATGPYEAVKNADGTTTASTVGPEGHWSITQVYVALKDGGFALVQVASSETASDEGAAAAKAAVESIALEEKADEADGADAKDAGAKADDGRAQAGGFTFALPEGLSGKDGVWLGTTDNVLVETTGTLVSAADAKTLDDEATQALFEAAAEGMGGTFEGSSVRKAGETSLTVGVFSLTSGSETYECLMVLVPVADGSVEGLTAVCDPAAAKAWADKLDEMISSIEVVPADQAK